MVRNVYFRIFSVVNIDTGWKYICMSFIKRPEQARDLRENPRSLFYRYYESKLLVYVIFRTEPSGINQYPVSEFFSGSVRKKQRPDD